MPLVGAQDPEVPDLQVPQDPKTEMSNSSDNLNLVPDNVADSFKSVSQDLLNKDLSKVGATIEETAQETEEACPSKPLEENKWVSRCWSQYMSQMNICLEWVKFCYTYVFKVVKSYESRYKLSVVFTYETCYRY